MAAVAGSAAALAAIAACDSGAAVAPDSALERPTPEPTSWITITGIWPERVVLSDPDRIKCFRYTNTDEGSWTEFTASTSDFAEYDGGGDVAEKQVAVEIHAGDKSTNGVIIEYIGPNGAHFRLGTSPADVKLSDSGTTSRFTVAGQATSIDAAPTNIIAEGQIHCSSITDQP